MLSTLWEPNDGERAIEEQCMNYPWSVSGVIYRQPVKRPLHAVLKPSMPPFPSVEKRELSIGDRQIGKQLSLSMPLSIRKNFMIKENLFIVFM